MVLLLKQPLLHFLLLGALLFVWNARVPDPAATEAAAATDSVIVVDRTALLDYLQYQAKAFDAASFNQQLDAMTAEEKQQVIDDYVREEALYREALRMQMQTGDYIIKQRLVQKVEFLLENLVNRNVEPDEVTLAAFYAERQQDYRIDAVYSFTHIFFDAGKDGMEGAKTRANALLPAADNIGFNDAGQHGDRFPFLQNYVERTRDFVVNNFSMDFVTELDRLNPAEKWQGPLSSRYGYHLVMLTRRSEPSVPPLDAVRDRVLDDYRYETLVQGRKAAEQEVVAGYEVRVELESVQ
jgi:hypothetical protein